MYCEVLADTIRSLFEPMKTQYITRADENFTILNNNSDIFSGYHKKVNIGMVDAPTR